MVLNVYTESFSGTMAREERVSVCSVLLTSVLMYKYELTQTPFV